MKRRTLSFAFTALTFFMVQTIYGGWHMHQLINAPDRETKVMLGIGRYRQSAVSQFGPAPVQIEPQHHVAAVLAWHPELEPVFLKHGFDLLRNPVLRRTVARHVSLQQACRMKGVDLDGFLAALNDCRKSCHDDPRLQLPSMITINGAPIESASLETSART